MCFVGLLKSPRVINSGFKSSLYILCDDFHQSPGVVSCAL